MDLIEGLSIEEALDKYDLSFKDAVNVLTKSRSKKKKTPKTYFAGRYIQKSGNYYYLRKTVNGTTKLFGSYNSLEDAEKVRDYCIKHGWYRTRIDAICKKLGVERVKSKNTRVRYS